jgi:uncharacterized protein (UPF0335 family)
MHISNREERLERERQLIKDAADRLLGGRAQRSSGKRDVVALAEESGINRTRLYEQHREFVDDFRARAGLAPVPPNLQGLQGQLDQARERIKELEAERDRLAARIETLCAVITELTQQAEGTNVVVMRT